MTDFNYPPREMTFSCSTTNARELERNKKRIRKLYLKPENVNCADCGARAVKHVGP